ncbi:MAG: DNA repair protein RadA [Bacteroidota bacterium]|nr:DNA repair protein RadA [Bacteroidota bacterium]MDP4191294.1 DNA repair protein RadA [Bacteroidota bacterium]MDP4195639.1 DNA repair protein RadA [Bacteroidota bacterium]
MSKTKTKFICSECGYESLRWLGRCPECEAWNSFSEELVEDDKLKNRSLKKQTVKATQLKDIVSAEEDRIKTNIDEFDRVLGGGLMPGSIVLIGGDPGIGKSTLVMQAASKIKDKVLYVTGEESNRQVKLRASRLKVDSENFYMLAETEMDNVIYTMQELNPSVVIIDSIQTMYRSELDNAPGTITQIRECTAQIMQLAKSTHQIVILIGHVTKEGMIAGPKVLEHVVDTVLQFEGERNHSYRILRAQKNRFGSTNEIGIFEMHDNGLTEVSNPSEIFLSERDHQSTGSSVTSSMEGTRPILLEVQALVTPSNFGNPQRVATGFDYRRLSILLAVLEKRAGLKLSSANVFLNMAGGVKIDEPAVDLAVCCSIASSLLDRNIKSNYVVIGEVGLGGEVRSIGQIEKRIQEAEKLGFEAIIIPKNNFKSVQGKKNIKIVPVDNIHSAINTVLQ